MGMEVQQKPWGTGCPAPYVNWLVTDCCGMLLFIGFLRSNSVLNYHSHYLCCLSGLFALTGVCIKTNFITWKSIWSFISVRFHIMSSLFLSLSWIICNFHMAIFRILDASLGASASPDCSLKMAFILSRVINPHSTPQLTVWISIYAICCDSHICDENVARLD